MEEHKKGTETKKTHFYVLFLFYKKLIYATKKNILLRVFEEMGKLFKH